MRTLSARVPRTRPRVLEVVRRGRRPPNGAPRARREVPPRRRAPRQSPMLCGGRAGCWANPIRKPIPCTPPWPSRAGRVTATPGPMPNGETAAAIAGGRIGSYRMWGVSPLKNPTPIEAKDPIGTHTRTTRHILSCGNNPLEKPNPMDLT